MGCLWWVHGWVVVPLGGRRPPQPSSSATLSHQARHGFLGAGFGRCPRPRAHVCEGAGERCSRRRESLGVGWPVRVFGWSQHVQASRLRAGPTLKLRQVQLDKWPLQPPRTTRSGGGIGQRLGRGLRCFLLVDVRPFPPSSTCYSPIFLSSRSPLSHLVIFTYIKRNPTLVNTSGIFAEQARRRGQRAQDAEEQPEQGRGQGVQGQGGALQNSGGHARQAREDRLGGRYSNV